MNSVPGNNQRVLFLGFDRTQTCLIDALTAKGCVVSHTAQQITEISQFDLVISFGYRHLLKKNTLASSSAPILNLHASLLPFNRGAHPSFWAFYDGTPNGVSIHLVDEGIDTGAIIYQQRVRVDPGQKTFAEVYKELLVNLENLFLANIDEIIAKQYSSVPQSPGGTFHRDSDLPKQFRGWGSMVEAEIQRLQTILQPGD